MDVYRYSGNPSFLKAVRSVGTSVVILILRLNGQAVIGGRGIAHRGSREVVGSSLSVMSVATMRRESLSRDRVLPQA